MCLFQKKVILTREWLFVCSGLREYYLLRTVFSCRLVKYLFAVVCLF